MDSVINFNIHSFSKNWENFLLYLQNLDHDFDIIILTESWGKEESHSPCHISGYNSIHSFRKEKKGGGINLYIKENLNYREIETLNISNDDIECVAANIEVANTSCGNSLKILGIYRPPRGSNPEFINILNRIINDHKFNESISLIAGDINICLLKEDFSNVTNDFMNLMRATNFYPLITRPTRVNDATLSLIDHIWINTPILPLSGILLADVTDHYPVFCILKHTHPNHTNLTKITFRMRKTENYQQFKEKLNNLNFLHLISQSSNVNDMATNFIKKLDELHNSCSPIHTKRISNKQLSKPWVTSAILNSIKHKHDLFRLVKLNLYNPENYKNYCNTLKTTLRNAKRSYFNKLFDKHKSDIKRTWTIINSSIKPGRKHASIKKIVCNNQMLEDESQIAEALNEHFSSIGLKLSSKLPSTPQNSYSAFLPPSIQNSFYLSPANDHDVKQIISNLKNKKGNIHTIPIHLYKEHVDILTPPIVKIFNSIISCGHYPEILKIACVTGVFKSGDTTNPNNYRPISSLPILNIIIEKLLYNKLINFLEFNKILTTKQFGFRKGISTQDGINELVSNIYTALEKNEYTGAVFLDLSKAFDTVSHKILLKKLEHYGIRGLTYLLLSSYLSNRKQYVSINGNKSQEKEISIGVPQGSVLGPLLFLIYINDLPRSLTKLNSILFADDTTLYSCNKNIKDLCDIINKDLKNVQNWLTANRLTLNSEKTYYMIFSLRKIPNDTKITLESRILERRSNGKFLGLILDDKLTFREHILEITKKISRLVGLLYKLKLSFPQSILKQLYYSLIYPYLIYCLPLWGCTAQTILEPLVLVLKKIVRLITSSEYLAHTNPLFKETSILKLKDLYSNQVALIMHKILVQRKREKLRNEILLVQSNHNYQIRESVLRPPFCRLEKTKQNLIYKGILIWNSLPTSIRNKTSIFSFKRSLKEYFISTY